MYATYQPDDRLKTPQVPRVIGMIAGISQRCPRAEHQPHGSRLSLRRPSRSNLPTVPNGTGDHL